MEKIRISPEFSHAAVLETRTEAMHFFISKKNKYLVIYLADVGVN